MPSPLDVRDLTAADHDAALDVRTRSFGALSPTMLDWWTTLQEQLIAERRAIGVFDGDRLVGQAKLRPYVQVWGGRPVPMGGAAGVTVLPEHRGRGVGTLLMQALAERCAELGDAVSALYPATVAPYRRGGWEIVGAQQRISIDAARLRGLGASVPLRACTPRDVERIQQLQREHYATRRANGPKLLTAAELGEAVTDRESFGYLADDGFVLYEWHEGDLLVTAMVAATGATARALWSVVGSGSSVVERVHAFVAPDDPIHLLLAEEASHTVQHTRWMLRVLDARAAVAARGWPEHVTGSAALALEDATLPANAGSWRLEVSAGSGSLNPTGPDEAALTLGPRGLAALYAGTPMHALRTAGLATGGSTQGDAFLDAALAGTPAHLLEYF